MVPIDIGTGVPDPAIPVDGGPSGLAMAPDGRMLYVACGDDGTITPIVATGRPLPPIRVAPASSSDPSALAVAPASRVLYVANQAAGAVAVITLTRR